MTTIIGNELARFLKESVVRERRGLSEHTVVLSLTFLFIIGERAKRARRYLIMSIESQEDLLHGLT